MKMQDPTLGDVIDALMPADPLTLLDRIDAQLAGVSSWRLSEFVRYRARWCREALQEQKPWGPRMEALAGAAEDEIAQMGRILGIEA
jgi:hypothetical protein